MNIETLLKSAPTTEDGGDFVLFDEKYQFVGQFQTPDEAFACIKEHDLNRPFLCPLSLLSFRMHTRIHDDLYVF